MISRMLPYIVLSMVVSTTAFAGDVQIEYNHAGLTGVKIDEKNRLHLSWHTQRRPFDQKDISPMRQNFSAYDSHSSVIWLTKAELERLSNWAKNFHGLKLKPKYPEREKPTYGSAFQSSLTVAFGDTKLSRSWTGDTKVPDSLHEAINKLVKICHEIRKSRQRPLTPQRTDTPDGDHADAP